MPNNSQTAPEEGLRPVSPDSPQQKITPGKLQVVFNYYPESWIQDVVEYAFLPSGKIVVMTECESYWFDGDGKNPKSYLTFVPVRPLLPEGGEGEAITSLLKAIKVEASALKSTNALRGREIEKLADRALSKLSLPSPGEKGKKP